MGEAPEPTRRYHLCMNIAGFMRNNRFPEDYLVFERDDGTPMEPQEAREMLGREIAKGHKVLPCSSECGSPCDHADKGCVGFDYFKGGCPGYLVQPSKPEPLMPITVDPLGGMPCRAWNDIQ